MQLGWKGSGSRPLARPPQWARVAAGIAASTVFVGSAFLWLATLLADTSRWNGWPWLFGAVFLPFLVMMIDMVAAGTSNGRPDIWNVIRPVWRRLVVAVLLAVAIVCFWQQGFDGSPTIENGHFYLSNHGQLTEITEPEWRRSRETEARMFIAGAMFFSGVAALSLTQPSVLRRDAPEDRPVRHH